MVCLHSVHILVSHERSPEDGQWDTSKALVRRTLERCIHIGRQHRSQGKKQDEYEAYRLLGQAVRPFRFFMTHIFTSYALQLHTLEDFPAHSNFCELALASMGHQQVFLHVGDQVRIQAPNGKWVAPIVTGKPISLTVGELDMFS